MPPSFERLIKPHAHAVRITHDGPQGQPVYEHRFQVAFKESARLSRKVYYSHFIAWIGKIRELPMQDIAERLLDDFLTGQWGMVTNSTSLDVFGEATSYDVIQARAWVGEICGSSFDTHIEFSKLRDDGSAEPLALGTVRATWVQLVRYGVPSPRSFPPYVEEYLQVFAPQRPVSAYRPAGASSLEQLQLGRQLYHKPAGFGKGKRLWSETFQTTLEEANLVGNVYYGNYFIWQGRARDMFLYSVAPDLLRTSTAASEMVCRSTRMDYLREAMPFDRIRVDLSVDSVSQCGAELFFEFYREEPGGKLEKLSVGRQEVVWIRRGADGKPQAAPWPDAVREALTRSSSVTAA